MAEASPTLSACRSVRVAAERVVSRAAARARAPERRRRVGTASDLRTGILNRSQVGDAVACSESVDPALSDARLVVVPMR